jgi:putative transposase
MCREEEALFRRADHVGVAASGRWSSGRRRVPPGGDLRADVLPVEGAYGSMLPSEARELKQLRDENTKLKRLVADLSLDKVILQDIVHKKF